MEQKPQIPLEEDDLQGSLAKAKAWWDKHGTKVLLVVLVIALAITGKRFYERHLEQQRDDSWGGLASATSPDVSRMLAESYSKPGFQASAYLRAADLLLYRAFQNTNPNTPTDAAATDPTAPNRERDLTEARSYYQKVLNIAGVSDLFKLNAKLGLAAIAEELTQTNDAKALYLEIEKQAGGNYPAIAAQARARGAQVDRLARPVQFAREVPRPLLPTPGPGHNGFTGDMNNPLPNLPGDFFTPGNPTDSTPSVSP